MATRLRPLAQQSTTSADLNIHLHPKQWVARDTTAIEVLYGGAAGDDGRRTFPLKNCVQLSSIGLAAQL
jgi:hypothetical protein